MLQRVLGRLSSHVFNIKGNTPITNNRTREREGDCRLWRYGWPGKIPVDKIPADKIPVNKIPASYPKSGQNPSILNKSRIYKNTSQLGQIRSG